MGPGMSSSGPDDLDHEPKLVQLLRYAISGGLAGNPVSVTFRDFPADVVAGTWSRLARSFPSGQVAEVSSRIDVKCVSERLSSVRIILVYPSRGQPILGNLVDWIIEHRRAGEEPLPSVFSVYRGSISETPGSTLVVNGSPAVTSELVAWLFEPPEHRVSPEDGSSVEEHSLAVPVNCRPVMQAVRKAMPADKGFGLREARILEGLLAGVVLSSTQGRANRSTAALDDYVRVRKLLRAPYIQKVEVECDDLTRAMVNRANAFLRLGSSQQDSQPAVGARAGDNSRGKQSDRSTQPRTLTHLQLVDLGNPKSKTLKNLISSLREGGERDTLKSLGIKIELACPRGLPARDDLIKQLPTWSYKQVRTRFERLKKRGLIETLRPLKNGSNVYVMPEELQTTISAFSSLPSHNDVRPHYTRIIESTGLTE